MSGDLSVVRPSGAQPASSGTPVTPTPPAAVDAPAAAGSSSTGGQPVDQLEVLRALERGDIDVEGAARLLEGTDHA
jgi:hypothetical protein